MRTFRCKQCWIKESSDWEKIVSWIARFCCKKHRLDFINENKKHKKEKIKIRKTKIKVKKANSVSVLKKKCDKLWSEAVKIEYNYECQYCWKKEHLNSHHLFTRARNSTRFDIDNGICLCSWCHTLSSNFSAHQTWLEFFEWLEWIRGRDWIDKLSKKSRGIVDITPDLIKEHIKNLQNFINKYNKDS